MLYSGNNSSRVLVGIPNFRSSTSSNGFAYILYENISVKCSVCVLELTFYRCKLIRKQIDFSLQPAIQYDMNPQIKALSRIKMILVCVCVLKTYNKSQTPTKLISLPLARYIKLSTTEALFYCKALSTYACCLSAVSYTHLDVYKRQG